MSLQDYLIEFKVVAAEWFEGCAFIKDNYDFFTEFFKKENLIKANWPDFQKIGNHIHAFNSMAIAKQNALGRMNHPIEHYRNSFIYLVHGEGTVEERINNFVYDKRYKIKYFGASVISEILGYIFAGQFVLYNERDKFALSFLNIDPGFSHGDNFTQKYSKFNKSITHLIKEYNKIVGRNLDVPINLEVDQFFSYLYEKYHVPAPPEEKYWQIAPGENAKFWDEFKKLSIAAVGFKKINTDLSGISESKFKPLFQKHYPDLNTMKRTQLWNFINLKPGNKFITNQGKSLLLGAGEVKSGYKYMPEREEFKHTLGVEYYRLSEDGIPIPDKFKGKFGKTITKLKREDFDKLESLLNPVSSKNYWWLNANPKIWDFHKLESDETEIYTSKNEKGNKRRVYKYFEEVKPGDIILGYISSPTKEIVGLCEVTKGIHESAEGEGFEFKKVKQLNESIPLQELQSISGLENCEPLKNNQGSLFKLTEDEFKIIRAIIDKKNPKKDQPEPYSIEKALETVFVEKKRFRNIVDLLNHKKNIIIQGPPGVGKTFIAKHIAWAMIEKKDDNRIQMVQFHQSYSYEDFVQGFRPDEDGNFYLKDGIFYKFCKKAERDKNNNYFFIIDEINRGNLSKIFGELMMLIESDKRGEFEIPLTYSKTDDTFTVPPNIYLIGTMNTADRSLAMVDYALRRRFCFVNLIPAYETDKFNSFLAKAGVDKDLIERINNNISGINKVIENDKKNLGTGFKIGHSYFCTAKNSNESGTDWYERIVDFEIAPLLLEYWFDRPEEAERHIERLKNKTE
jgi:5-methylcytosine-specific restriction enzyme B